MNKELVDKLLDDCIDICDAAKVIVSNFKDNQELNRLDRFIYDMEGTFKVLKETVEFTQTLLD